MAGLLLYACKPSAKLSSTAGDKSPDAKTQLIIDNLYIEGCKERMAMRLDIAEGLFLQAGKLDPHNIPVKYELARIYRYGDSLSAAIKLAKECVEADPKNEWYHMAYIEGLHMNHQFAQAADAYDRLVKIYPEKNELAESMAIEYALAGNYAKSFKIYDELEKRFGTNETYTLNKIKLLREQKKFADAETELKKLLDSNPQEPRYYTFLAEYYEDLNQYEKAKVIYDKLLQVDPNNPMAHLALANYYKETGKPEQSHSELKTAFSNPDMDINVKCEILRSYFSISEEHPEYREKALELSTIFLKVNPTSPLAHSFYADYLIRDNKDKEARDHYLIAANYDKNHKEIWEQLLRVEEHLRQFDSIEHHSYTAMELFPSQPIFYFYNGEANFRLRNYKKAVSSLNDGLEFVYNDKSLMLNFFIVLGDAYHYLNDNEKSDKSFDDALKVDPDNAYVLNNYGYYLSLRKEKLDKAEKYSRRSIELKPNEPNYLDTYGWILYQQGKYKEAEEQLAAAVKLWKKDYNILEHYGDVLFKLGRTEEALKWWTLAKDTGGTSEALLKKISEGKLND
ncbi:MAG: tetratricopeptide repeat protein [Bacteroidia bacterium]